MNADLRIVKLRDYMLLFNCDPVRVEERRYRSVRVPRKKNGDRKPVPASLKLMLPGMITCMRSRTSERHPRFPRSLSRSSR